MATRKHFDRVIIGDHPGSKREVGNRETEGGGGQQNFSKIAITEDRGALRCT